MRWLPRRPGRSGRHSASHTPPHGLSSTDASTPAAPFQRLPAGATAATPPTDTLPIRNADSGVYLGFVDGSLLQLPASDPRANTFRALARTLAQGNP
jgi:hypothetical protein